MNLDQFIESIKNKDCRIVKIYNDTSDTKVEGVRDFYLMVRCGDEYFELGIDHDDKEIVVEKL